MRKEGRKKLDKHIASNKSMKRSGVEGNRAREVRLDEELETRVECVNSTSKSFAIQQTNGLGEAKPS